MLIGVTPLQIPAPANAELFPQFGGPFPLPFVSGSSRGRNKTPRTGWLKQQTYLSQFWQLEVQGKMLADLIPGESPPPGLQPATF